MSAILHASLRRGALVLIVASSVAVAAPDAPATDPAKPSAAARSSAYAHFLLARERERLGDVEGALKEYRAAADADPDAASVRVAMAGLLADSHRVAEAMDVLRQALRIDGDNVQARRLLAMLLLRLRGETHGDSYDRDVRLAFEELVRLAPDDLEARRTLGKLAYEQGDFDVAEREFLKVLAADSDDVESRIALARTYFQKREYDKAAALYQELDKGEVGSVPDREKTGEVLTYLFAEKYEDAIRVADDALSRTGEDSSDYGKLLKLKAFAAEGQGDHVTATRAFKKVLELDPGDREARFRLAQTLQRRRDLSGALDELSKVQREMEASPGGAEPDPPYAQVLFLMGAIHLERKAYDKAADLLGRALALVEAKDRLRPAIVDKLARAQFESGKKQEAFDLLRKTIDADPDMAEFSVELAELYAKDGQAKEADRIVKAFLKDRPGDEKRDALLLVADMRERLGQHDEALDLLEQARAKDPSDDGVWFMTGSVYERAGRLEDAEAAFKKAIALNPKSDRALNYLGYMLADRGIRVDESVKYIEQAIALDRFNGAYLDSMGWAYYKAGRLKEALDSLQKAVDEMTDDPLIRDHLGDVLYGLGRYDDAVAAWQKSLDLGVEKPEAVKQKMEEARAKRTSKKD